MGAPQRVAVIGSGVAGLLAAHVAAKTARVTLFEADDRLGGHADTHLVDGLAIDTGFIVHNQRTYPTLLRLFRELDIDTQDSEMSLSVRDDATGLEYAGALGPRGLFPSSRNLRPAYLRMLGEIPRFHRAARRLLTAARDTADGTTLREFLATEGFPPYFTTHFMEPLVAAVWSCDPDLALDYPARYLFEFLQHHGMLRVFGSPPWRTVTGGSREYVARVAANLDDVRLATKVTSVVETADDVHVTDGNGRVSTYDAVVIATHPGQALAMLAEPTPEQRIVLGAIPYSRNVALLHTDTSLLPRSAGARASWNFLRPVGEERRDQVTVTYDLTRLQRLDTDRHYLVTLGGEHLVDPAHVLARREYEHPLYTPESVAAQARLPGLTTDRVAFAGAYHGWGFHEDGARSGLAAAERLGLSWTPRPASAAGVSGLGAGTPRTSTSDGRVETPTVYATTIRHVRSSPIRRSFTHRSHTWLVDVDRLPDHGPLARFEARDHLGDPDRSIRENIEGFLAGHGVDLAGGRMLLAAHPRSLGHCFNPISVFWCFDADGAPAGVVVEVHNTYGDRHAYLVRPDEHGRATTPKAMYVSPFHGIDGTYQLAVPVPDDRLRVAVTLRTEDDAVFTATLTGRRTGFSAWRTVGGALRGSVLIRAHGLLLWTRGLKIQARPAHHQEGVDR